MPEIVILSGKGGTGKTSLSGAFASLAHDPVICDLDVDAPDLHLLLQPKPNQSHEFWSGTKAHIDQDTCTACGLCAENCRFTAIAPVGDAFAVDPLRCEGCTVCQVLCPEQAVEMVPCMCGHWHISQTRMGPMVHAQLFPGQENSGRLVALLRQQARELQKASGRELIICDGPPGIGCPVISSVGGADLAVLVTEPTPSGLHDLARVAELCTHFSVPAVVIINKSDLSLSGVRALEDYCREHDLPVAAHLPFDPQWNRAVVQGRTIIELGGAVAYAVEAAWQRISAMVSCQQKPQAAMVR